ncbi:AMP-binding protein [Pseudoalteromonas luteoviolacea]|uniref:AMP-binding protein n=1 Tax=Pseudoalteromonas luteoviolacea TaxID=43657 RepID=UPI00114E8649|nr:AMP-binding protein [Pseudoalteromonas luteoviolacea]TQF72943.1 D-alanine--poly(phosphoribitol) ligase [Pseudoalteromonas luteoviolacea]
MYKQSLAKNFLKNAEKYEERVALFVDGRYFSYRQLLELVLPVADQLVKTTSPFCVLVCEKNINRYVGILAALLADKTYVPICPNSPDSVLERVLNVIDSDCFIIDTSNEAKDMHLASKLKLGTQVVFPSLSTSAFGQSLLNLQVVGKEQLVGGELAHFDTFNNENAYLMFTSGSTGIPKGVMVSHENVQEYLRGAIELFNPDESDRVIQLNSYTFDLSVHDIFLAWSVGASLYAVPENAFFKIPQYLAEHEITFWLSVPTTGINLNDLNLLTEGRFEKLKYTLFCGEPLPESLARAWHKAAPNGEICNIYGPTECTIAMTCYVWSMRDDASDIVPIGVPFPGQEIVLLDANFQQVSDGDKGEIFIGGSQVVEGYYNNEAQTLLRFVTLPQRDGVWYRSGDLAVRTEHDGFQFTGRCDDQLQVRGYRIERLEVETLMRQACGIESLAVVGWPILDANVCGGLVAFVSGSGLSSSAIKEACRKHMPEYMWPSKVYLQDIPLTKSLKVDYPALKKQLSLASTHNKQIQQA